MHNQANSGLQRLHFSSFVVLALVGLIMTANSGCFARLAANMLYALKGNDRPAEYSDMKDKRVAVICRTSGAVASEAVNSMLTGNVASALSRQLPKTNLVPQEEIDRWMQMDNWSDSDPLKLAKGVKADRLIVAEVDNLKLRDGATLFRGQCDIRVTVYDMEKDGRMAFHKEMVEYSFPQNGGTPVTDTTEAKFRSAYLQLVGYRISSLFYAVDPTLDVAMDATAYRL